MLKYRLKKHTDHLSEGLFVFYSYFTNTQNSDQFFCIIINGKESKKYESL